MSHLKPKLATIVGSVALLALLGISSDAQAARRKPVARNSVPIVQTQPNSFRSSYGALNITPRGRAAPGTNILGGGPSAGWGGPP